MYQVQTITEIQTSILDQVSLLKLTHCSLFLDPLNTFTSRTLSQKSSLNSKLSISMKKFDSDELDDKNQDMPKNNEQNSYHRLLFEPLNGLKYVNLSLHDENISKKQDFNNLNINLHSIQFFFFFLSLRFLKILMMKDPETTRTSCLGIKKNHPKTEIFQFH